MNGSGLYVIRGKSGMKFDSCEVGKIGQEETYFSRISAEFALMQIQYTFPFDEFEIKELEEINK